MQRHQRGGTLIGLAFGLVVGVLISFGVVWFLNKTPLPFVEKTAKPETKADAKGTAANGASEAEKAPVALPGKPGDKPVERKFDFYDILEGKKPVAPAGSPAPAAKSTTPPAPTAPAAPQATSGSYLQVGAFQKSAEADNLRARLAILGFEASVLEANVPDKGVMHRVRIGPYANIEEMNRARAQLSQNNIPAKVVQGKE